MPPPTTPEGPAAPSRRTVLAVAALAGAAAVSSGMANAADDSHHHHGHHGHQGDATKHQAVIDVAAKCMARAEACLDHCYKLLGTGDTSLKECVRTVSAMVPMCAALMRLAALDSNRLKALAGVCIDVCGDCETECKKHQEHHALCRACAESCRECIDACKKLVGA